ncbi:MAG: RNA-binding protein [Clostridia bacterium]|nr:RNA-binding protein [Clostridia bacterium]
MKIGQVVRSLAGRDQGRYYVVMGQEDDKLLLVDGYIRRTEFPKRKNPKHVQKTNHRIQEIAAKTKADKVLTNKEINRALSELGCLGDKDENGI